MKSQLISTEKEVLFWVYLLSSHPTKLHYLSCLSVLYQVPTRKDKGVEKPKLVMKFPRAGVTGVLVLGSTGQKLGSEVGCAALFGWPHNMPAPGRHIFLVCLLVCLLRTKQYLRWRTSTPAQCCCPSSKKTSSTRPIQLDSASLTRLMLLLSRAGRTYSSVTSLASQSMSHQATSTCPVQACRLLSLH